MKKFLNKHKVRIILLLGLAILYFALYKIYIPRVNAFGCFDDCNNFMGGYFLLHGKRLFSEIFFNHAPFMAYVSWFVQFVTHPQNLYELILRHRQFLLVFSFLFNVLLLFRFGIPAFAFALFYELTKFYLFGDRFLAEPFIVYPLIYLVGLAWLKVQKKNLFLFDYIFAGVCTWFIIFMREPYVPAALLSFGYLLWKGEFVNENFLSIRNSLRSNSLSIKKFYSRTFSRKHRELLLSFSIFSVLTLVTLLLHDVNELIFNVATVNVALVGIESDDIGFKIFFYPIFLFFGGEWGYFRYLILSFNVLFLISSLFLILKKQWRLVLGIWLLLGLLNIRWVEPGKVFYGAFHLLCWYAVFLFVSFMMLRLVYRYHKKIAVVLSILYSGIITFHIFSPLSFIHTKPDPQYELITNYGIPMQVGNVVNALSQPTDTLFVDGFDDIIYWQAHRYSLYKYSWYTSLMPVHKKYTDARIEMFKKSPPDFYYGSCPKEKNPNYILPSFIRDRYVRLYAGNDPSCLWVNKSKIKFITEEQWKQAEFSHYYLPPKTSPEEKEIQQFQL